MNRRTLIKLLLSGVAGHTLDVDRLLWIPGAKTIFIPTPIIFSDEGRVDNLINEYLKRYYLPKLMVQYEGNDTFYEIMRPGNGNIISRKI